MTECYTIYTFVEAVEHKKPIASGWKDKDTGETRFTYDDLGWFVHLAGSRESLHIGHEEPTLKKGDQVRITIEKV